MLLIEANLQQAAAAAGRMGAGAVEVLRRLLKRIAIERGEGELRIDKRCCMPNE